MTIDQILKAAALAQGAWALVADARAALSETDQAVLDAKLKEIGADNDAGFLRLDAKLEAEAGEG